MLWFNATDSMIISYKESLENYADTSTQPYVLTRENGDYVDINTLTIFRGHRAYLMKLHQWDDSNTLGGYAEAVTFRFLRRKYGNHTNIYNAEPTDFNHTVQTIVNKLAEKYYLHDKTSTAVVNHLKQEAFRL